MNTSQIHVFISHSWFYSGHYDNLSKWIFDRDWSVEQVSLDFRDNSVPINEPIHNADNDIQLKNAIYDKISSSHIIIVPIGMYGSYSKWIQKEIEGANEHEKPILAVNPWEKEKKNSIAVQNAIKVVGWDKDDIVAGIWELFKNR